MVRLPSDGLRAVSAILEAIRAERDELLAPIRDRLQILAELERLASTLDAPDPPVVSPAQRLPALPAPAPAPRQPSTPRVGTYVTRQRTQAVLDAITEHQPISPKDIASRSAVPAEAVKRILAALRDAGKVTGEGAPTTRVYRLTATADAETAARHGMKRPGQRSGPDLRWPALKLIRQDPSALTEDRICHALNADREDVALACGRLLEDGSVRMNPDATYTPLASPEDAR